LGSSLRIRNRTAISDAANRLSSPLHFVEKMRSRVASAL
jgi:hypothetical protein